MNLTISFEDFLLIRSSLSEAYYEAKAEARRGKRCDNIEMHDHYMDHANRIYTLLTQLEIAAIKPA